MYAVIHDLISANPLLQALAGLSLVALAAIASNLVVRLLVLRGLGRIVSLTGLGRDEDLRRHNFAARLTHAVPAAVVLYGTPEVPHLALSAVKVIQNVATAYIILTLVLAVSSAVDAFNAVYTRKGLAVLRPIKGYLQVFKIAVFIVAGVICLGILLDRSPVILLSGLGAMAAVLILVFQDTLLSFVASVQISSSQMVKVGDWVQVPKLDVDGTVTDIALYHITVRNWDMSVTTVPIRKFIGEPMKNWRGMFETGARRIKRSVFIDQSTVRFMDAASLRRMRSDPHVGPFLRGSGEAADTATNAGLLRRYLEWHLRANPAIDSGMRLMIRTTDPTPSGIPLEIYCFSRETEGLAYERVQSDIFDHALAVMPRFGLAVFQSR